MAALGDQLQLVIGRKAGQVAHIAGLHYPIPLTDNPQTWHRQPCGEHGQLPHRLPTGTGGQQPPGGPGFRHQGAPPG